jgi:hypothetical protein
LPKSDFKTICNATIEGSLSLGGCTVFFANLFDTIGNRITTFKPVAMGLSLPSLLVSIPFSVVAGYGAYKCHDEVGKSNQPQVKLKKLHDIADEIKIAEDTVIANADQEQAALDDSDEKLQNKTKTELLDIIKELKTIIAAQKAELTELAETRETEERAALSTPLWFMQKLGITGEYIAHSAGFAGDILAFMRLFNGVPVEAEIVLQACCLVIGYVSAMSEARTAEQSMRLNNLRENLLKHHSLFKQQTTQKGKIEIRIDSTSSTNSVTTRTDSLSSEPYHSLAENGATYPHPLSPASSLFHVTP